MANRSSPAPVSMLLAGRSPTTRYGSSWMFCMKTKFQSST